jgi:aminopeptidase N
MKVVQFNHIQDNGYYALNNVPQSYTYAHTVYDKGAVAVSKIRNYMGDSAFFQGVKDYLNNRAWTAVSSLDLRDELQNSSGINMTDYFNTIIATPGFPQVSIDSFVVTPNGGNYDVTLYTREKQKGNSLTFSLPVDFTFSDRTHDNTIQFIVNAPTNSFSATLPFIPQWTAADRYGKLLSATLAYERTISDTGTYTFPDTYSSVHVLNPGVDTSIIRIEHNYVKPDDFIINPGGVRLSDYRYYKVDGLFSSGMQAHATFTYDGSANPTSGYLDNTLFSGSATEDSLLIFYRSNSGENWQLVNGYSINFVVLHTDKKGMITVDTLKRGEYVLGVRDFTSGIFNAVSKPGNNLEVSPNPSNGLCHISFHLSSYKGLIEVADAAGKKIYSTEVFSHQQNIDWDSYHVQSGIYFVQLIESGKVTGQQKVLVQKK